MQVDPLISLDALLLWGATEPIKEFFASLSPLTPKSPSFNTLTNSITPSPHIRTLVCHDLKGGYLDDRFCYGSSNSDSYRFYHWPAIDIFVYFSHHFVTIPPAGWVSAAHIHGVKILGTIITEWDGGASLCDTLLANDATIESALNNLVDIACTYRFDGWLVNIENKIKPDKVKHLAYFVEELTKRMHSQNPYSEVIWYDSVTKDGLLLWQNELNKLNRLFFDVCDGIFLNYSWKEENLKATALAAQQRQQDVYVGVDVWGRNFWEGGGYNSHKALKIIREYNLSTAIFAPGWTYEAMGSDNFFANDIALWSLLEPFLLYHGPTQLPFKTSFCQGYGKNLYSQGKILKEGGWYNLSKQQFQPNWEEISRRTLAQLTVTTDAAFSGGSCFLLWVNDFISVRLMVCQFMLDSSLEATFTYQIVGNVTTLSFVLDLAYSLDDCRSQASDLIDQPLEVSLIAEVPKAKEGTESTFMGRILPEFKEEVNGWIVKRFLLSSREGWIAGFRLKAKGPGLVKLGEVSLKKAGPKLEVLGDTDM